MLVNYEYCLNRAAAASADAKAATLKNVREQWLRSEQRWKQMASHAADSEKMRAKIIADKIADRAAVTAHIMAMVH